MIKFLYALENYGPIRKDQPYMYMNLHEVDANRIFVQDFKRTQLLCSPKCAFKYETYETKPITIEMVKEMLTGKKFYVELSNYEFFKDKLPKEKFYYTFKDFYSLLNSFGEDLLAEQNILLSNILNLLFEATNLGKKYKNSGFSPMECCKRSDTFIYRFLESIMIYFYKNKGSKLSVSYLKNQFEQYKKYVKHTEIDKANSLDLIKGYYEYHYSRAKSVI
jgi:hypothetical protein